MSLRSLAVSALLASAVVSAAVVSGAAPASAAVATPPLVLRDDAGASLSVVDAAAHPSFASATAAEACPAGADAARLVVEADGRVVISSVQPLADAATPPTVEPELPLADATDADAFALTLECVDVQQGVPVPTGAVFSVDLTRIDGVRYRVTPAPAAATTVTLTRTDDAALRVGGQAHLVATVAPGDARGTVTIDDGAGTALQAEVSEGRAQFAYPLAAAGTVSLSVSFVSDDPALWENAEGQALQLEVAAAEAPSTAAPSPAPTEDSAPPAAGPRDADLAATGSGQAVIAWMAGTGVALAAIGGSVLALRRRALARR
ncbi:hypothetical protein [Microbacterium sp. Marseille-Q6965]|uniref:hypothetical protein n=1 Tax=Microbacterium sp. Marseille-Q6965 TaxID=2965072 RepID=UPI0021B7FF41|nr:hypothetical protein [Microbacterium sp. Marseille-Q6965]